MVLQNLSGIHFVFGIWADFNISSMSTARRMFTFAAIAMILGDFAHVDSTSVKKMSGEKRLMTDLFRNYTTAIRPVVNKNDTITVTCDAALHTITKFDQKDQYIQTNLWFRLKWEDYNFRWNPEDYGGVNSLVVPADMIWKPDIFHQQNRNQGVDGIANSSPLLTNTGVVYWNTPANLKSPCKIDPSYFPFDEQRCLLIFSSWSYNDDDIHFALAAPSGDISIYQDNGIWELLGMLQEVNVKYYGCCPRPYADFTITIVLRRRPLFYLSNLLLPCVVLSVITLFVFLLSADSGEKISLVVTNLLSLIVFMLQLSKVVPATSDGIPLMVQYNAVTIAIVSISMVMAVFVLRLHHRPGLVKTPVPAWLKRVAFTYMAPALFIRAPAYKVTPSEHGRSFSLNEVQPSTSQAGDSQFRIEATVASIEDHMKRIASRCRDRDNAREVVSDWKHVAKVFDRMFFVIFLITTVVFTVAILFQPTSMTSPEEVELWSSRSQG